MTKQTTTHIKRILAIVLTIAIVLSLFAVVVSASNGETEAEINPLGDSNGETEPRRGLSGDSNIEEVKPEKVSLGDSGPTKPRVYAATTADLGYYWVVHYDNSKATQISTYEFDYLLDFTVKRTTDDDNPSVPRNRGWMSYIAFRLPDYSFLFEQTPQVAGTEVEFTSTQFADYDTTNGVYLEIRSWNKIGPGIPASADTLSITINIDYIRSTIATHNPINPSAISGSSVYTNSNNAANSGGTTQTWVVTGPNGYTKTVTGDDIDSLLIYTGVGKLAAGDYTVKLLGAGETVNGTTVPDDYITDDNTTFNVQYPAPTVTIDKPENPTNIVVAKEFTDSTYTWQVYELNGSTETEVPEFSGTGGTADASSALDLLSIKNLPLGSYRVRIVETDATNLDIIGEAVNEFTIAGPHVVPALVGGFTSAPASPALPANPTSGTGTPKFLDSTVTWEILDEGGSPTGITGTNATDLEAALTTLPEGEYELQYTETASYNGFAHSASVPFQIINPLTSSKVTGSYTDPTAPAIPANPTLGEGAKKLPDSTIGWKIKDSSGNVVDNRTELTVPEEKFTALGAGDYKLEFTETSIYNGETSIKSAPFKVVNPLTSANVDVAINPTTGTGTQKMPAGESVVTWEILDSNNQVVGSGTGLTVPTSEFIKLAKGDYTLGFTETSGYNGAKDSKETSFKITSPVVPVPKGTLEVKHIFIDDKGNVVTNPATITKNYTENVGTAYTTTALATSETPAGYRLVKGRPPANATGQYVATHTVVEYYYEPTPVVGPGQGTVTVVHTIAHTDGSVTIVEKMPIIGAIDTLYTTTPINIPGYILKEVPPNQNGSITTENQRVNYVYIPDPAQAQLVEKHILLDSAGNVVGEVAPPLVTVNPNGTPYTTSPKAPVGYELVVSRAPANAKGEYKTGVEQIVIYYYAPIVTPPTTPGGAIGGGSWSPGGWTNPNAGGNYNGDKSPYVLKASNLKATTATGNGIENSPEDGNAREPGVDSDATNPQTGDITNQAQVLTVLYVLLGVSLVILLVNLMIPKKRKRQR